MKDERPLSYLQIGLKYEKWMAIEKSMFHSLNVVKGE
jgi:hypothetical protein